MWITSWRGLVPRSWVSVDDDTRQPSFTAPIDGVVGHEHVVEEDLVEVGLAGDLAQRAHVDARRRACRRRTR